MGTRHTIQLMVTGGNPREIFGTLEEGDVVQIASQDGDEFAGVVQSVTGEFTEPGPYVVRVNDADVDHTIELRCRILEAEPSVGIERPYAQDGGVPHLHIGENNHGLVDSLALQ